MRDDDYVQAGEVLVRLDDTQTKANLAVFTKSLDELHARQARQEAEKEGAEKLRFPTICLRGKRLIPGSPTSSKGSASSSTSASRPATGQKAQLRERASQLREEINGLAEQIEAKTRRSLSFRRS